MKVLCLLSGGMDSTVLLWWAKENHEHVEVVSFNYGQRHVLELTRASVIAEKAGVEHHRVNMPQVGHMLGSALTDPSVAVPHGHYEDESMRSTVVPNRNMIMLSIAAGVAISRDLDGLAYAAHSGDHAVYPDCRPEFGNAIRNCLMHCHYQPLRLWTPFVDYTKAEVCSAGAALGAPLELTWSCYEGGALHCGLCGTCVERKEAFELAEVEDLTGYADA